MECPICGHRMEPNDAFCSNCGNFALPLQDDSRPAAETQPGIPAESIAMGKKAERTEARQEKPPKKVAKRLYPVSTEGADREGIPSDPPDSTGQRSPYTGKNPLRRLSHRKLRILTWASMAVALTAVLVAVSIIVSTVGLQVQLNKAQKESSSAQAKTTGLENQVDSLSAQVETLTQENKSLGAQVAQLQSQLNGMESSVNQNQYDKESALRQLNEAQKALDAATREKTDLESRVQELTDSLSETQSSLEAAQDELYTARERNNTLESENESLNAQLQEYQTQSSFYDEYVVFVMLDSSEKYYHKYSCPDFTQRNFLAYSVRLAEANGYTACPVCGG